MLNLFIISLLKNFGYGILEPIMQVKHLYNLEKENICVCVCVCVCVCECVRESGYYSAFQICQVY